MSMFEKLRNPAAMSEDAASVGRFTLKSGGGGLGGGGGFRPGSVVGDNRSVGVAANGEIRFDGGGYASDRTSGDMPASLSAQAERARLLARMDRLSKKQECPSVSYSNTDTLAKLRMTEAVMVKALSLKQGVKMLERGILFAANAIEWLTTKGPLKGYVDLEGYSNHLSQSMSGFQTMLEEAYEHLSIMQSVNPVSQLAFALLSNMAMYALTRRITNSKLAEVAKKRAAEFAQKQQMQQMAMMQQQQKMAQQQQMRQQRPQMRQPQQQRRPEGKRPSPSLEQKIAYLRQRQNLMRNSMSTPTPSVRSSALTSIPELKMASTSTKVMPAPVPPAAQSSSLLKPPENDAKSIYTLASGTTAQTAKTNTSEPLRLTAKRKAPPPLSSSAVANPPVVEKKKVKINV